MGGHITSALASCWARDSVGSSRHQAQPQQPRGHGYSERNSSTPPGSGPPGPRPVLCVQPHPHVNGAAPTHLGTTSIPSAAGAFTPIWVRTSLQRSVLQETAQRWEVTCPRLQSSPRSSARPKAKIFPAMPRNSHHGPVIRCQPCGTRCLCISVLSA